MSIDAKDARLLSNPQLDLFNAFVQETGIPIGTDPEHYIPQNHEFWFIHPKWESDVTPDSDVYDFYYHYVTVDEYLYKGIASDPDSMPAQWGYMGLDGSYNAEIVKRTYHRSFSRKWYQLFLDAGIRVREGVRDLSYHTP